MATGLMVGNQFSLPVAVSDGFGAWFSLHVVTPAKEEWMPMEHIE
jgi:hypothetical protein